MADAQQQLSNGHNSATENINDEAQGVKVFAGNLAYAITDEDLKAFFDPVKSDILSCQVILRNTRSAGYGFVALATQEAAHKACEALNGKELHGRTVVVEVAKPNDQKDKERAEKKAKRRVGRRGTKPVPGEVSEAEANGEVEKPQTAVNGDGASKPQKKRNFKKRKPRTKSTADAGENGAAVEGDATAAATAQIEKSADGEGKKKAPKPKRTPRPKRPVGEEPVGEQSTTTLFVANLAFSLDDEGLAKIFTDAGFKVNSARVVRRRWGHPRKSKGYGFVDVGNEDEQKRAIEALQGKELEGGRQIAIKIAVNPVKDEEHEAPAGEKTTEAPLAV